VIGAAFRAGDIALNDDRCDTREQCVAAGDEGIVVYDEGEWCRARVGL
jgi:hypothetical protein